MGCDIHFYVETKQDDKWISADKWSTDPWECNEDDLVDVKLDDRFYDDRNYLLFGILAGVRNHNIRPIKFPRGLPEDVSPEVKKRSDEYGSDGHSHSWLTLAELQTYDWNKVMMNRYHGLSPFVHETMPKLEALGNPESVRIVFFFDN